MKNTFFMIFVFTVVTTRALLYAYPVAGPTLANFRIHHYHYGIVGIIIGALSDSVILYGVGMGLFIDELAFVLLNGKNHEDNYSRASLLGTTAFVILVFFLRAYLVRPI